MSFTLKIGDTIVSNPVTSVVETVVNASDLVRRPENAAIVTHAPAVTINLGLSGMSVMELLQLFEVDEKNRSTKYAVLIDSDTKEEIMPMDEYNYIQTITRQITAVSRAIIITLYRFEDCTFSVDE